jgi:parallel beta-helix repeat protein
MDKKPILLNRMLVIGIIVLFIGMCINPSTGTIVKKTIIKNTESRGYIQDLIDNASDGDTIYIPSGTYYENIVIDKSINLIGEDKDATIIDGGGSGNVIQISADWVNISGFKIQNSGRSDYAGISLESDYNCITDSNISLNNGWGIFCYCDYNFISNNLIFSNYNGIYLCSIGSIITNNTINFNGESGIHLVWCLNCTVTDNILDENGIGMYECSGVVVENNVISNSGCGLGIGVAWGFSDCIFSNNSFYNSGVYIDFFGAFENNKFYNNTVNGKPLIYLEDESDFVIEDEAGQVILKNCDNITIQNQELCNTIIGALLGDSNNCLILNNTISSNLGGIELVDSSNNIISSNTISNNSGNNWDGPLGGINIESYYTGSSNNIIFDNIISNNNLGIRTYYSDYNISGNTISNNIVGIKEEGSVSANQIIMDNTISNNEDGIIISSTKTRIIDNVINGNNNSGITISGSFKTIEGNTISNNKEGISLVFANNNDIIGNNISNNEYGINSQYHSHQNNITKNTISNSFYGIYLDSCNEINIISNDIKNDNFIAIEMVDCEKNTGELRFF